MADSNNDMVVEMSRATEASRKIAKVLSDIRRQGYSRAMPFSIGKVERRMRDYAERNGITLGSNDVYMSSVSIAHAMRDTKERKGLTVTDSELISFPLRRRNMDLFYDGNGFVYTDMKTKYVVHNNYKIKLNRNRQRTVMFVTAGKVTDPNEFYQQKYIKI